MKAVIYSTYGPPEVLKITKLPKPSPRPKEVLVRVHASSVTAGSLLMRRGTHPSSKLFTGIIRLTGGLKTPKKPVLGYEFSGEVVAIGKEVTSYQVGDQVFGTTSGLKQGAYAEYVCVPEKWPSGVMTHKPPNLSHYQAAVLPIAAMTTMHFFSKVTLTPEMSLMIYGASGSVGSAALQIAKAYGCHVTAVCSQKNFHMVQSLGADRVIDYQTEKLDKYDGHYQVIFDAVGKINRKSVQAILAGSGHYFSVNRPTSETIDKLNRVLDLVKDQTFTPYIDQIFDLDQIQAAHQLADTGHKRGNIAIRII